MDKVTDVEVDDGPVHGSADNPAGKPAHYRGVAVVALGVLVAAVGLYNPLRQPGLVPIPSPLAHAGAGYGGCGDCTQLARDIAWSMDNHPEEWSYNGYRLARGLAQSVWVGGGLEALTLYPDARAGHGAPTTPTQPSLEDRELLWRSASALLEAKRANALQEMHQSALELDHSGYQPA